MQFLIRKIVALLLLFLVGSGFVHTQEGRKVTLTSIETAQFPTVVLKMVSEYDLVGGKQEMTLEDGGKKVRDFTVNPIGNTTGPLSEYSITYKVPNDAANHRMVTLHFQGSEEVLPYQILGRPEGKNTGISVLGNPTLQFSLLIAGAVILLWVLFSSLRKKPKPIPPSTQNSKARRTKASSEPAKTTVATQVTGFPELRITANGKTVSQRLISEQTTLGRATDNDLVLPHPTVSGHHAKLYRYRNRWYIEDLKSTNGTQLDGEKVIAPTALKNGSKLTLGEVAIVFVL